jgi:uncharacterized protein (UPF0371 family)
MNKMLGGTKYARKMDIPTYFEPLKRNLSIAYAAHTAQKTDMNVDDTVTTMVFHNQRG